MSDLDSNPQSDTTVPGVFERFLGVTSGLDNPATLLGLSPDNSTETAIIAALQRQLTRVGASPDALTPEADEVRLALHAAAARLLDPTTRRQALASPGVSSAPASPSTSTPPGEVPVEAAMLLSMGMLGGWNRESMQRMTMLARSYGMAPDQAVAVMRGLLSHPPAAPPAPRPPQRPAPPTFAPSSPITARPVAPVASADRAGPASLPLKPLDDPFAPSPEQLDPARGTVKAILLFGGLALAGVVVMALLFAAILSGHTPPTPSPTPGPSATIPKPPTTPEHQLFPVRPKDSVAKTQPIGTTPNRIGDWNDLLRDMSNCVSALEVDAAAAEEHFASVYSQMAHKWGEASPDGVVAGVDRIVEYLYHATAHPDLLPLATGIIVDGAAPLHRKGSLSADQVSVAAWSSGVMARLSREKDLPASVRHRVQESLSETFPGSSGPSESTFKSGAVAALSLVPARLAMPGGDKPDSKPDPNPDPKHVQEAWKTWLAALSALDGKQSPLFTRSVLIALDTLLAAAPEPTQDHAIFDAVELLTISLPWRKDDESRRWLLRWFDSPTISAGDLYAVTSALATQSGAEGVDSSMVLSASAGESQRADLRDRYASVWGLIAGQTRDALVQQWVKAVHEASSAEVPADSGMADALERAVNFARLNQAASLIWSGDTAPVPDLLEPYHRTAPPLDLTPVHLNLPKVSLLSYANAPRNPDWLVRYCGAGRNISLRHDLLVQHKEPPDPAEADVLIQEACRASSPQLHSGARAIILNYKDNAAVINAMLEFAPMVPITTENSELIEQISLNGLPNIHDSTWRVAVRRALVERLTQVLAGQTDLAKVDDLSDALTAAYAESAPAPSTPAPSTPDSPPPSTPTPATTSKPAPAQPLELAAMSLRGRWQREAELLVASGREPLNLGQILSTRSARLRLAVGRIQEFAAEQVNICELMSYVVAAEQPGRAEQAGAALDELSAARRKARHIFLQLEAGERARLRLWLTRFGEPQA